MISGLKFTENSWLFAKYKWNTKNPWVTRDHHHSYAEEDVVEKPNDDEVDWDQLE